MSKKTKIERSHEHYEKMLRFVEEIIIDAIAAGKPTPEGVSERQRDLLHMYRNICDGEGITLPLFFIGKEVFNLSHTLADMLRYASELDDAANAAALQSEVNAE